LQLDPDQDDDASEDEDPVANTSDYAADGIVQDSHALMM
jgi:hypothetical protein